MKALTLTQPWASLVAMGAKKIETRSWYTSYRGPLAIHASKYFPPRYRALMSEEHFDVWFQDTLELPLGAVIAIVNLVECQSISVWGYKPDYPELAFGDYSLGRFMWFFEGTDVALPKPIPARGALGLWEWNPETMETML